MRRYALYRFPSIYDGPRHFKTRWVFVVLAWRVFTDMVLGDYYEHRVIDRETGKHTVV